MKTGLQVISILILSVFLAQTAFSGPFQKKPKPQNNMPKTMEEYKIEAQKQAEKNKQIPPPQVERDEKIVRIPDPQITLQKYNNPPGQVDIDLSNLKKKRKVNSIGVANPNYDMLAYTSVFYYPASKTVSSELYILPLDESEPIKDRVANANIKDGITSIYKTGMDTLTVDLQRTLTIVDWSEDGKKLAIKEKIASIEDGMWKTNLLVYDFSKKKMRELPEVREAIKYYWLKQENLDLNEVRWDIYPIGWDALNPDRIIVFAYAYTGEHPKYLGAWSIDYEGDRTKQMSLTGTSFEVSQNGSALKLIPPY